MPDPEYYDDLGGAYHFADEKESFEARTPDSGGCGCLSAMVWMVAVFVFMFLAG